jgi:hypothetical protein
MLKHVVEEKVWESEERTLVNMLAIGPRMEIIHEVRGCNSLLEPNERKTVEYNLFLQTEDFKELRQNKFKRSWKLTL